MLGWPPRHHRQNGSSSGSRCPPHTHTQGNLQSPCLNDEKQPHQIVIGFDLGLPDHKGLHAQASDSPRSVLEPEGPRPPSPQSPLSALGSLLTGRASCTRADIAIDELSTNVHVANNVVGKCSVDKIGPDLSTCSKNSRSRAANDQRNVKHRERRGKLRCRPKLDSDDEHDGANDVVHSAVSIFSAGSPSPHPSFGKEAGTYFLSKCYRCRRKLVGGKDIYMYRGDQAFCSQDCRCLQIAADERKHRSPAVTPCISRVSRGVSSVARATQTAFA